MLFHLRSVYSCKAVLVNYLLLSEISGSFVSVLVVRVFVVVAVAAPVKVRDEYDQLLAFISVSYTHLTLPTIYSV